MYLFSHIAAAIARQAVDDQALGPQVAASLVPSVMADKLIANRKDAMLSSLLGGTPGSIDLGLLTALMVLGVFISFKVLNFADLTVDGSFVTGGAVVAIGVMHGWSPLLMTALGCLAGCAAGAMTGLLNTVGRINPLLAGILTQISLYSINLRIMGQANINLLNQNTLLSGLRPYFATWRSILLFAGIVAVAWLVVTWFLSTNVGLGMQASGDNETMARAQGTASKGMVVLGLAVSNGLVALSGGLFSQYAGFADISMGIGTIVAGLASVIIGQAIFGDWPVWRAALAAVAGSVIYRVVIQVALALGLKANDMKIISAVLVIAALLLPRLPVFQRLARARHEREIAKQVLAADMARVREAPTRLVEAS